MPMMDDLRKEFRRLIERDGRTHREIAHKAGIHPVQFSRFVNGKGNERNTLSPKKIERLAKTLGAQVSIALKAKR